jgi:hypothetical protein
MLETRGAASPAALSASPARDPGHHQEPQPPLMQSPSPNALAAPSAAAPSAGAVKREDDDDDDDDELGGTLLLTLVRRPAPQPRPQAATRSPAAASASAPPAQTRASPERAEPSAPQWRERALRLLRTVIQEFGEVAPTLAELPRRLQAGAFRDPSSLRDAIVAALQAASQSADDPA